MSARFTQITFTVAAAAVLLLIPTLAPAQEFNLGPIPDIVPRSSYRASTSRFGASLRASARRLSRRSDKLCGGPVSIPRPIGDSRPLVLCMIDAPLGWGGEYWFHTSVP
jgi:hypothetical protein